jgi:hypothetical protein
MNGERQPDLRAAMRRLIAGHRITQALGLAAQLAIADLLADGPRASDDLARLRGCNPEALYRVLRLLSAEGVFAELDGRRFALTPLGELLRTGATASLRAQALIEAREWSAAWSELAFSVATGEPAFPRVFGAPAAAYYAERPPARALFQQALAAEAAEIGAAVSAAYDFGAARLVAELPSGGAALLPSILAAYPGLRGTSSREGEVPSGTDVYLLRLPFTGWDDDRLLDLFRNCRRAMRDGSVLLIVEPLSRMPHGPVPDAREDVNRLVMTGGQVRSESAYASLLGTGGLRLSRVIDAAGLAAILEAHCADPLLPHPLRSCAILGRMDETQPNAGVSRTCCAAPTSAPAATTPMPPRAWRRGATYRTRAAPATSTCRSSPQRRRKRMKAPRTSAAPSRPTNQR